MPCPECSVFVHCSVPFRLQTLGFALMGRGVTASAVSEEVLSSLYHLSEAAAKLVLTAGGFLVRIGRKRPGRLRSGPDPSSP